jgi:hypothetical protein
VRQVGSKAQIANSFKEITESLMISKIELANELMASLIRDNGGVRLGLERRQFSYDKYIPERRSGKDRRNGLDRRLKPRISEY